MSKYCDHLPLHRQAEIYACEDIDLSCSSKRWDGTIAGERVHANDTVVPVVEPGLGRTRMARLWVYVHDDRPFAGLDPVAVFYRYTSDREGKYPWARFSEFRGILQADGYAGFAKLDGGNSIVEAACLADARQKFWDVHEMTKSPLACEGWTGRRNSTFAGSTPVSSAQPRSTA
jgi:hypothetical protein